MVSNVVRASIPNIRGCSALQGCVNTISASRWIFHADGETQIGISGSGSFQHLQPKKKGETIKLQRFFVFFFLYHTEKGKTVLVPSLI